MKDYKRIVLHTMCTFFPQQQLLGLGSYLIIQAGPSRLPAGTTSNPTEFSFSLSLMVVL
jgi:hypothetical protein